MKHAYRIILGIMATMLIFGWVAMRFEFGLTHWTTHIILVLGIVSGLFALFISWKGLAGSCIIMMLSFSGCIRDVVYTTNYQCYHGYYTLAAIAKDSSGLYAYTAAVYEDSPVHMIIQIIPTGNEYGSLHKGDTLLSYFLANDPEPHTMCVMGKYKRDTLWRTIDLVSKATLVGETSLYMTILMQRRWIQISGPDTFFDHRDIEFAKDFIRVKDKVDAFNASSSKCPEIHEM